MTVGAGTLYLFPAPLCEGVVQDVLPAAAMQRLASLHWFLVEEARSSRRFFSALGVFPSIAALRVEELPRSACLEDLQPHVEALQAGEDAGLLSAAGLPVLADPGAALIALAQMARIKIMPMGIPSAPIRALIGSGFSGQSFHFHGYLPIRDGPCVQYIGTLRQKSKDCPQLFIETPYRNNKLLERLMKHCPAEQLLCIASSLDSPKHRLQTRTIQYWQQHTPCLHKKPTVFILGQFPRT